MLELLECHGFQVIGAKDGLSGLMLATQQIPALILSDINMPKLNGYGLLNALRQKPKTAKIPLIFMTGDAVNLKLLKELELVFDGYLNKPVKPEKLLSLI